MIRLILLFFMLFSNGAHAVKTVLEVVPLYNRSASDLSNMIQPLLEESERIIANGSQLIIKASPNRQRELKKLIEKLDSPATNLSITVIQSRTKTADQLNASGQINFRIPLDRAADVRVNNRGRFAQTQGLNKSDSTQVIKTLDGKPATIRTGKTHPVHNVNIYNNNGYPAISSNTQYIEATTGFVVTPRLTGDQVTLQITPWSDKMSRNGTINTQSANSTLRVNLGEWVEIGGVSQRSRSSRQGSLSHVYSTRDDNLHISIKVDKEP